MVYLARLRCLRIATEGLFSGAFLLPSTGRCPAEVLLVTAPATVFLDPFVLKPCQFSAGSALRCNAATALLLGLLSFEAARSEEPCQDSNLHHTWRCMCQHKQTPSLYSA